MRRFGFWIAAAALLATPFAEGAGRTAETATVDRQAWAETGSIPAFAPAEDRLYVGALAGNEYARTFVHVAVDGFDAGSFAAARLVFVEDNDDSVSPVAGIAACALAGPFTGEGRFEGEPPAEDCSLRVDALRTSGGTWVVELGVFAERWAGGEDHGLVLFPATTDPTATFRVSLDPEATALDNVAPPTRTTGEPDPEPEDDIVPDETGPTNTRPTASFDGGTAVTARPPAARPAPSEAVTPVPAARVRFLPRDAARPGVFGFMAALLVLAMASIAVLRRRGPGVAVPPRLAGMRGVNAGVGVVVLGLVLLPLRYSELTVFRAGTVLIFVVAALGLHVLVNWTGQLSLAHSVMVGLPAFAVAGISEVHQISPLYLLPLGLLVGAFVGVVVALPTLRARGLQVALVTFAAGVAMERFLFNKTWVVGPLSGRRVATPSLGPIELTTNKGLYPVVVAIVALVALALWAIMHSRVGRAWFWIRSDPDAAAAVGVPVGPYKILAFATAGALAGVAGGLYATWIQHMGSSAFPNSLSFDYLLAAVLAGHGYVGGVFGAALVLQGGRLFFTFFGWLDTAIDYAGPLALILNLTRYQAGFNGFGRLLMEAFTRKLRIGQGNADPVADGRPEPVSLSLIAGAVLVAAGFIAIALAWYHTGNTDEVWLQNQELVSGGVGGLGLVVVGATLLIRDRLARQHAILARQLEVLTTVARFLPGSEVPQPQPQPLPLPETQPRRRRASVSA